MQASVERLHRSSRRQVCVQDGTTACSITNTQERAGYWRQRIYWVHAGSNGYHERLRVGPGKNAPPPPPHTPPPSLHTPTLLYAVSLLPSGQPRVPQHAPWGGDGGAEETAYGLQCIDYFLRSPNGTSFKADLVYFNWGLHDGPQVGAPFFISHLSAPPLRASTSPLRVSAAFRPPSSECHHPRPRGQHDCIRPAAHRHHPEAQGTTSHPITIYIGSFVVYIYSPPRSPLSLHHRLPRLTLLRLVRSSSSASPRR
jgi:hypothetical protein